MTDNMELMVIDPNAAILSAKARYETLRQLIKEILVEGVDYGTIPGTEKPCLYKAGSEKLCSTFGFDPRFEVLDKIENFSDESGLFHYTILCRLIHIGTGAEIATGIGSCNSKENRYRWRWVQEEDIPAYLDKKTLRKKDSTVSEPQFAVDKAETTGQYGKPAEYWQRFKDAIANRTAYAGSRKTAKGTEMATWNIPGTIWRIPNDEIFTLANTIQKMATKRALVAATLIGTNASETFSQDLEDMMDFSADFVSGKATPVVKTLPVEETTSLEKKDEPATSPAADKIIVDTEADKLKAAKEAKEKELEAERENLMKALVGDGKAFATATDVKDQIVMLGYKSYAEMREKLSYEAIVAELTPKKAEAVLQNEPTPAATNGATDKPAAKKAK